MRCWAAAGWFVTPIHPKRMEQLQLRQARSWLSSHHLLTCLEEKETKGGKASLDFVDHRALQDHLGPGVQLENQGGQVLQAHLVQGLGAISHLSTVLRSPFMQDCESHMKDMRSCVLMTWWPMSETTMNHQVESSPALYLASTSSLTMCSCVGAMVPACGQTWWRTDR